MLVSLAPPYYTITYAAVDDGMHKCVRSPVLVINNFPCPWDSHRDGPADRNDSICYTVGIYMRTLWASTLHLLEALSFLLPRFRKVLGNQRIESYRNASWWKESLVRLLNLAIVAICMRAKKEKRRAFKKSQYVLWSKWRRRTAWWPGRAASRGLSGSIRKFRFPCRCRQLLFFVENKKKREGKRSKQTNSPLQTRNTPIAKNNQGLCDSRFLFVSLLVSQYTRPSGYTTALLLANRNKTLRHKLQCMGQILLLLLFCLFCFLPLCWW